MTDIVSEHNLSVAWYKFQVDFTHTSEREGITHISTLDHFFLTDPLMEMVSEAGVIHHPDNTADHEPIYCIFSSITISKSSIESAPRPPRPSWRRATGEEKEQYNIMLEARLRSIMVPVQVSECQDIHCKDEEHLEAIDWFTREVLEGVQAAAEATLPCPRAGDSVVKHKITPGFNERVKPFKEASYFWHQVWKSAGRPLNTELHNLMKRTRNRYHMEHKKCVKAELTIKKSKLLDACLNGNGDLFKEIKAMRRSKPTVADSIDGVKEDIPEYFSNIYRDLYNSVSDGDEVKLISEEIEIKLSNHNMKDVDKVNVEVIKKAASKLKPGKGDPVYSFSSDCLKTNSSLLSEHTAAIIKSFLVHGYIPQFMLISTLVPIIKDKLSSINVSKKYRSVCITSLVLKQLDWVTIHLFGDKMKFHDLQFAYQPGVSAPMCSWAVIETVNYFLNNGSDVFACSQDKSKAFDMCKFSVLFRKMMVISLVFLRLIIYMYVHQFCNVFYNNQVSSGFSIGNGVGQGKILAGTAYCFYCRDLFDILEKSGFGCEINGVYAGAFGYSDDDLLLSPSITGLRNMIRITEIYGHNHGLKFSTDPDARKSKTKCISWMRSPRPLPRLRLCGHLLPWVDRIVHLGNTLTDQMDIISSDMKIKKARYISKNIEINQEFSFAATETKLKVNDIYNSSWFGSGLWDLSSQSAIGLESSYNRSAKIMLNLPFGTHRELIEPLTKRKHLRCVLIKRFLKMIENIRKSDKKILLTLLYLVKNDAQSVTGRNVRYITMLTGSESVSICDADSIVYHDTPEEREWRIELIETLLEERELNGLEEPDLELLEWLCTD